MSKETHVSVMPKGLSVSILNSPICEAFRTPTLEEKSTLDRICGRDSKKTQYLGGFVLPEFQRPLVWKLDQKVRFIESIWMNIDIGRYVVMNPAAGYNRWTNVLIDGQQRISAILDYVDNAFPVFGYHYKNLPPIDRRNFDFGKTFAKAEVRHHMDESEIREMYNRMNFGGTAHTEEQRA